jgi:hypothetical protein
MSMEGLKLGMTTFFSYLPEAKKRCRMLQDDKSVDHESLCTLRNKPSGG